MDFWSQLQGTRSFWWEPVSTRIIFLLESQMTVLQQKKGLIPLSLINTHGQKSGDVLSHQVLQDSCTFASVFETSVPKLPHSFEGCSNSSHHIWFPTSRKEYRRTKRKDKWTRKLSLKEMTGTLFYYALLCFVASAFFFFSHKLKVCGNAVWRKSINVIFPIAFAHFVTFLKFSKYVNFSIIMVFVMVMFD